MSRWRPLELKQTSLNLDALIKAGQSGVVWGQGTLVALIMMTEGMVPGTWMLYHNTLQPAEVQRLAAYILNQPPATP